MTNVEKLMKLFEDRRLEIRGIEEIHADTVTRYIVEVDPIKFKGRDKFVSLDENIAYLLGLSQKPIISSNYEKGILIDCVDGRRERKTVLLSSLLEEEISGALPMVIGNDTYGNSFAIDLIKAPHLLIAGTTGSGKSVGLRGMITSLIYYRPDTKFVFIDPKGVELSIFNDHKKDYWFTNEYAKTIVNVEEAYGVLEEVREYSETVFARMSEERVSDVSQLKDPQRVVVVIDELADLVSDNKEFMKLLLRIVQKSRAAGVHVIAATQRPSTDIVTGTVKANFPSRISFKVSARQDSQTILGGIGSERLLGKGDLLYMKSAGEYERIQGAFVDDETIKEIIRQKVKDKLFEEIKDSNGLDDIVPLIATSYEDYLRNR